MADKAPESLCEKVAQGKPFNKDGDPQARVPIRADLIRQLILGLADERGDKTPLTPAGIEIYHAQIDGRLELDRVIDRNGGSVAALEFHNCFLTQGFSGAHGKFSRLCFFDCTFGDPKPACIGDRPIPTVNLTDAHIDSDLNMEGVRPERLGPEDEGPRQHLWIRAVGAQINGKVELSRCRLRAPPPRENPPICDEVEDALNLTLATIRGDVWLLCDARCEGRITLRGAHIGGDVWMSGATVENPGGQAMLLEGACIAGFLMINGGYDLAGEKGEFRKFRCVGELNLEASEIGRSFHIEEAVVRGPIEAPSLTVRDDLFLHGEVSGPIDLSACRIGGSLDLCKLNLASSAKYVILKNGNVGRSLKLAQPSVDYEFVVARRRRLICMPRLRLVETLWRLKPGSKDEHNQDVPKRRELVQVAFLVDDSRLGLARIFHLDGHADVLERAVKRYGLHVNDEAAKQEYARLEAAYVLGDKEFEVQGPRCFENGLIIPPMICEDDLAALTARGGWLAQEALPEMKRFEPSAGLKKRIAHHVESIPLLQAEFDLEGLSCGMLADHGGRAWGEHLDRIKMNHFVYRRADWGPETRRRKPSGESRRGKPSAKFIWHRMKGVWADWLGPSKGGPFTERLREESDYLEPWQVRRNWIYRHFTPRKRRDLISISRFWIPEEDYRPQPFEQAILVARAEGREDYAARFEMLKSRNEWRIFNERARWWLGPIAITVGSIWLLLKGGYWEITLPAWAVTLAMMVWLSRINDWLRERISSWWLRRIVREFVFYLPALLLLVAQWRTHPFYWIVACLIYVGIRSAGILSNATMWVGFGYLRRPVRAVVTLIFAFLIGWWGVAVANERQMIVIATDAVADRAAPYQEAKGQRDKAAPTLMASRKAAVGQEVVHELPCTPVLSERLYALDVLIPLVDLNQESRCEVRRIPRHGRTPADPNEMNAYQLWEQFPAFLLDDHRFWWVMQALYAIVGWFIVSLALLTFTQVNRTRAEPTPGD